jgi:hypothetical protein
MYPVLACTNIIVIIESAIEDALGAWVGMNVYNIYVLLKT